MAEIQAVNVAAEVLGATDHWAEEQVIHYSTAMTSKSKIYQTEL